MINFKVNFKVDDMEGKTVLVFLKPQLPQRNYRIHAWQVLPGSAGASETFSYEDVIAVDVTPDHSVAGKVITSGRRVIKPGQLFQATTPGTPLIFLEPASSNMAQQKLTPQQCGVVNKTAPFQQFNANWYVNDHPVVTMPYIDSNMTVSFEYEPTFYFMVASPPMVGQTYIVQNFSDMTQYVAPVTATNVVVDLTRNQGLWHFDFFATR